MTSALVESRSWSRRRWWGMVGGIFVAQLALIFWLGNNALIRPRPAAPGLSLRLAGNAAAELLALYDPTLFALPHPQGIPAPAWLRTSRSESHSFAWPTPTNYPLQAIEQLGAAFNRFVETNFFGPLPPPDKPLPELTLPGLPALAVATEHSTAQLEGDLARRRLLTPLELGPKENPDILANSVVQIIVGAEGSPLSAILLSSSGSKAADQHALEHARAAQFEPLGRDAAGTSLNPEAQLTWGRMIFKWHTLPPRPTKAPTEGP